VTVIGASVSGFGRGITIQSEPLRSSRIRRTLSSRLSTGSLAVVPELPEVEAWVRELDPLVSRTPVMHAGPAHVATLKTIDPPLRTLEGRRLAGAERRGKNLLFPTADDELVLRVHLMSAGRLRHLKPGAKRPKTPMFRLAFEDGGELILTEAGSKKRAGVWLVSPAQLEQDLGHLGPDALELDASELARILGGERRQLHPLLRDQRVLAGIGRAHANEILQRAHLSPFRLASELDEEETKRLATAMHDDLARALELREAGKGDRDVYRVHDRLGQPCPECGTPIARIDFEEHTIYYCPRCQTGGRLLKDRRLSRLLR
jgi:formamidopyrimidine-DNA glycosylase